jgi:hypothetical protein
VWDLPASYHKMAAGVVYADGHSDVHKWMVKPKKGVAGGNVDKEWLIKHSAQPVSGVW